MRKSIALAFFIVTMCALIFICSCDTGQGESSTLSASIDILKIGKADCIIINTGSHILMIDTGERENLSKICAYMQEKGYTQIDTLIITHYDKDHIGGAEEIIERYGVKTVYETNFADTTDEYLAYHSSIEKWARH